MSLLLRFCCVRGGGAQKNTLDSCKVPKARCVEIFVKLSYFTLGLFCGEICFYEVKNFIRILSVDCARNIRKCAVFVKKAR